MKQSKISNNVIRRLPRYLRKLDELISKGQERVSSSELAAQLGLTSSQIRQDLSCFGGFGQQGYGYNVQSLRDAIAGILGIDKDTIIYRMKNHLPSKFISASGVPVANGVIFDIESNGKCKSVTRISF